MDDGDELIPERLNYVQRVVFFFSEALHLNICRETLRQNQIWHVMWKNFAEKCLNIFAEIAEKEGAESV